MEHKPIPIVIPSHKRSDEVLTLRIFPMAILCIPESQYEQYRLYYPNTEILTHPDDIIGISKKRQWIYQYFGDVWMMDDDIQQISRVYIGKDDQYKNKLTPDEAYALVQDTYALCKENGFKFFGFNNTSNPNAYTGCEPINISCFITGGCFGMLKDENLYFPDLEKFVGEDMFINLLNAYYNRMCWCDKRFAIAYNLTEKNQGGCADFRTDEIRRTSFVRLKKFFGDSIIRKKRGNDKFRSIKSEYEKIINIPFWHVKQKLT